MTELYWGPFQYDSLLLGLEFGIDYIGANFLLFTALLWSVSLCLSPLLLSKTNHSHRVFYFFMIVTMLSNIGVILSQDIISFYMCFAIMNFSAFGLIAYEQSKKSLWASKVYIGLVIVGEALLLPALWLIYSQTDSTSLIGLSERLTEGPQTTIIATLIALGLGVKIGAIPLHVWLPLAHPVAPTPASAILSGVLIKAGILGWLRFLPLGYIKLELLGISFIVIGLLGAFYAAIIGLTQKEEKSQLAYSSVSQMGLVICFIGMGLIAPEVYPILIPGVLLFVTHHAIAKGALFLGVGLSHWVNEKTKKWLLFVYAIPCLALSAAPLSSGHMAKTAMKEVIELMPSSFSVILAPILSLTSVTTTLLMLWLFWTFKQRLNMTPAVELTPKKSQEARSSLIIWIFLIAMGSYIVYAQLVSSQTYQVAITTSSFFHSLWPIAIASGIFYFFKKTLNDLKEISQGDILSQYLAIGRYIEKKFHNTKKINQKTIYTILKWKREKTAPIAIKALAFIQIKLLSGDSLYSKEKNFGIFTGVIIIALVLTLSMI